MASSSFGNWRDKSVIEIPDSGSDDEIIESSLGSKPSKIVLSSSDEGGFAESTIKSDDCASNVRSCEDDTMPLIQSSCFVVNSDESKSGDRSFIGHRKNTKTVVLIDSDSDYNEFHDNITENIKCSVTNEDDECVKTVFKCEVESDLESSEHVENKDEDSKHDGTDQVIKEPVENLDENSVGSQNVLGYSVEEGKGHLIAEKMRLESEIAEVITSLLNKKQLLNTFNLDNLPDKGLKLKVSLEREQRSLDSLNEQLSRVDGKLDSSSQGSIKNNEHPKFGSLPSANLQEMGHKALETHRVQQALTVESLKNLHTALKNFPSDHIIVPDPKGLKVPLMTHQKQALGWLIWRENEKPCGGILADDMGLGKTLTMISLILKKKEDSEGSVSSEDDDDDDVSISRDKYHGGTLIISPSSIIGQWESEVKQRVIRNLVTYQVHHGQNREKKARRLARPDVVITSYAIARSEFGNDVKNAGPLFLIKWGRIILDEAHTIRNYKSQTSKAIFELKGKYRWALTGTPVHNKTEDFFALIKFLRCRPFDDIAVWKKWVEAKDETGSKRLDMLSKSLMLRRTKSVLMSEGKLQELPEKTSETLIIKLSKEELALYEEVAQFSKTLLSQLLYQRAEKENLLSNGIPVYKSKHKINEEENPFRKNPALDQLYNRIRNMDNVKTHEILVLLLRLRQICCHPALMKSMIDKDACQQDGMREDEPEEDILEKLSKININDNGDENNDQAEALQNNILNRNNPLFQNNWLSSKIKAILQLIEEKLLKTDDRIVIVSQWSSMLELIHEFLKPLPNCQCELLTGKVPVDKRMDIVTRFNGTSSIKVLLLSLTAGGTGLNLVGGNHLIIVDPHWNPQLEAQACDRVYRIGQSKPIRIYKFICAETIEERIQLLQKDKLALADGVLSGAVMSHVAKLSLNDLKMLFSIN